MQSLFFHVKPNSLMWFKVPKTEIGASCLRTREKNFKQVGFYFSSKFDKYASNLAAEICSFMTPVLLSAPLLRCAASACERSRELEWRGAFQCHDNANNNISILFTAVPPLLADWRGRSAFPLMISPFVSSTGRWRLQTGTAVINKRRLPLEPLCLHKALYVFILYWTRSYLDCLKCVCLFLFLVCEDVYVLKAELCLFCRVDASVNKTWHGVLGSTCLETHPYVNLLVSVLSARRGCTHYYSNLHPCTVGVLFMPWSVYSPCSCWNYQTALHFIYDLTCNAAGACQPCDAVQSPCIDILSHTLLLFDASLSGTDLHVTALAVCFLRGFLQTKPQVFFFSI